MTTLPLDKFEAKKHKTPFTEERLYRAIKKINDEFTKNEIEFVLFGSAAIYIQGIPKVEPHHNINVIISPKKLQMLDNGDLFDQTTTDGENLWPYAELFRVDYRGAFSEEDLIHSSLKLEDMNIVPDPRVYKIKKFRDIYLNVRPLKFILEDYRSTWNNALAGEMEFKLLSATESPTIFVDQKLDLLRRIREGNTNKKLAKEDIENLEEIKSLLRTKRIYMLLEDHLKNTKDSENKYSRI